MLVKVGDLEDVFAVRLGRPEAVKLKQELLLSKASGRYRDRLLKRSKSGEAAMSAQLEERAAALPDPQLIVTLQEEWRRFRSATQQERHAHSRSEHAYSAFGAAQSLQKLAKSKLDSLCKRIGLPADELRNLQQVKATLDKDGIDIARVSAEQSVLKHALQVRGRGDRI